MNDEVETAAESGFATLAALREAHYALLRRHKQGSEKEPTLTELVLFLRKAAAAGARLESQADRGAAQSVLDYWAAELIAWAGEEVPPDVPDLVPFDTIQLPDLSNKPSPFKGLNAFAEIDAPRFFGREEAAQSLFALVREKPLVVVSGRSGSGKSSLVMAGLLPLLHEDRSGRWQVLGVVVPGTDPLGALLAPLQAVNEIAVPVSADDREALADNPALLRQRMDEAAPRRQGVLVIDQFEEIFSDRVAEATRHQTVAAIGAVGERHRVVLTVRADYRDRVSALPELQALTGDVAAWMEPPPLSPRQLRAAIERPAAIAGLTFEEGLVRELVREVEGDAEALPLLQFTLTRLWERRERNRISLDTYREVGRPREALQKSAEAVYRSLPEGQRRVAERIFGRLVQPARGEDFVRRRVRREELEALATPAEVAAVLDRFVVAGLLRQSPGAAPLDDRFDVVHEALIRLWPRLDNWLRDRRHEMKRELQLIGQARQWRQSGEGRAYLLREQALAEAKPLRDLDPEIAALIRASEVAAGRSRHWRYAGFVLMFVCSVAMTMLYVKASKEADEAKKQTQLAREQLDNAEHEQRAAQTAIAALQQQRQQAVDQTERLEVAVRMTEDLIRRRVIRRDEVPSRLAELLAQQSPGGASPTAPETARLAALRGEGFNAVFLGTPLPLPTLSPSLQSVAWEGGRPLNYPNFSVVLNRERRMALFAVSNLDRGLRLVTPRTVSRFVLDPRVPLEAQPASVWFDSPEIDRGHLVTRQEVAWSALPTGAAAALAEANTATAAIDTYPNLTPQLGSFNRGIWTQLERWMQTEHNPAAQRVNFYTGPVLAADDPIVEGVQVPRRFWKIAVSYALDGALVVDAFLIAQWPERSVNQAFSPERDRITLAELSRVTGLDFGPLSDATQRTPPPTAATGEQIAALVSLLNADQATVRTSAAQRVLDAVRDGRIPPAEQRKVASALVDAMRPETVAQWTTTGRFNLLFVLSEIPPEAWARQDWSPLVEKLSEYAQALDARIKSGRIPAGTDTRGYLAQLQQRLTSGRPAVRLVVFVHVAGRDDRASAEAIVRSLGPEWPLAGVEYVPGWGAQARTTGEVRYYRPGDAAAAADLARLLVAETRVRTGKEVAFRAIDISRTFPNLPTGRIEVWFPQL